MKKSMLLLLAAAVFAGGSLCAQLDDNASFPSEFRKWAHVFSDFRN